MLEKIIYDYLNGALSVPAYLERPMNPPEKFVVIERTGGNSTEQIKYATFAVQAIAQTLYEAVELNEEVMEVMQGAQVLTEIGSVRLVSFYNFTGRANADRAEHRYQSIYEIVHY